MGRKGARVGSLSLKFSTNSSLAEIKRLNREGREENQLSPAEVPLLVQRTHGKWGTRRMLNITGENGCAS